MSYKFDYHEIDKIPGYVSDETDHWGYFNNVNSSEFFLTPHKYFQAREPNDTVMGYGILKKITYPTGGYTRFEFEPHKCGKRLNVQRTAVIDDNNRLVGGMRIKNIINSEKGDGTDEIITKQYFYVKNYTETNGFSNLSSGVLGCLPQYYYRNYNLKSYSGADDGYLSVICTGGSVVTGGSNSMGSHIGYTEVVEKFPDGAFNVYKYTNFDTGAFDDQPDVLYIGTQTQYSKFTSREHDRGLLTELSQYNNSFVLTHRDLYIYSSVDKSNEANYIRALYLNPIPVCSGYASLVEAAIYRIYIDTPKKIREERNIYKNGQCFTTIEETAYNKYQQPTDVTRVVNNRDKEIVNYKYIWEYPHSGCTNIEKDDFVLAYLSDINTFYFTSKTSELLPVSQIHYDYKYLGDANFVPTKEIKSYRNNVLVKDITKCEYDSKGRIIFMEKNGSERTVFLWGYKGRHIVAKIENATLNDIKDIIVDIGIFAEEETPSFSRISKLREVLPNALVTSYTYESINGITSKTSPQGISEYYRYDTFGRLSYITDDKGNVIRAFSYGFKD